MPEVGRSCRHWDLMGYIGSFLGPFSKQCGCLSIILHGFPHPLRHPLRVDGRNGNGEPRLIGREKKKTEILIVSYCFSYRGGRRRAYPGHDRPTKSSLREAMSFGHILCVCVCLKV